MRRSVRLLRRIVGAQGFGSLEYLLRRERAFVSGGPFNGQLARAQLVDELLRCRAWRAIVETGTFRGETTEHLAHTGIPVHSIEVSPRYFAFARLRLLPLRHRVRLHRGDSREILRRLAAGHMLPRTAVFFYLGAHWYPDLPLREEIELVFGHWPDAVALVDDFEVPGTAYRYDDYGPGKALTLAYLGPLAHLGLQAYFPTCPWHEETGHRRGCVVLGRDPDVCRDLDGIGGLRRHRPATAADPSE